MFDGVLDDSYAAPVRRALPTVTVARLATNAAYRYAPPFLATIARGLDVELADLGVALAITEICGLTSPIIGRLIDRWSRRAAMAGGLAGIAAGALVAGVSTGLPMFTVGLLLLALAKIVFDVGLMAWTADHVPFARRGRVVGVIETSWALGLLVGVSSLGLLTAATSWRWAYVVAAIAVLSTAGWVLARVDAGHGAAARPAAYGPTGRLTAGGWCAVVAMFALMAATQSLFVTFGPWLEDVFGFGSAGLAAVTFAIGGVELVASVTSAARTDRWGKERSVIAGALVMVPASLGLAFLDGRLVPGLLLLATFICAFEFSIVSTIPIGGDLVPGAPARGLGTMIAFGTLGRALTVIPATRLYERYGLTPAAVIGAGFATVAGLAMLTRLRVAREHTPAIA